MTQTLPHNCPLKTADYASWCPADLLGIDLSSVDCANHCPGVTVCQDTAQELALQLVPHDCDVFWTSNSS